MKNKTLRSRKKDLEEEIADNKALVAVEQNRGSILQGELDDINKKLNRANLSVTDHAVVRYMERVSGVDIEEIRGKIIDSIPCIDHTEDIKDMKVLKSNHYIVIKDNTIITVGKKLA